ncbi:amine oxidase : UDP-galactopyranose mutase OS=Solibacter usitatus (strain Ellin6076) GN=Acid_0349 PE=4 SV=1: Glyco_trans_1_4: NAD_binding_8: Amino_oxidase [Gemmataceae bacterium]|nr:amine oxidase : UDP-galactopyranose mutase OS=Solibacter usitatus (strain Ellin6076) GN=Acid_0349 PE=4 SV=1: Glyco_trans_1_4: NAD_binding_8: Amino_oxidase [Gemmataceae bacterium]VTT99035.1 amine oxidase : UDP-galactopyranose mutase OS=Solibacter usitatus (strain Ellin6076) GN=Acid_0349 PE=4 SV=1: Glyco_trans_1_4: NAD_binding_8: Amino_oxidase [Gemmataceae bacterium]
MPPALPLIVFCHLRWDFVFQRPQHLMSRFARTRPVLFVEEPVRDAAEPHWELRDAAPGVTVCRPHTPAESPGFAGDQFQHLRPLLADLIRDRAAGGYDVWFYTPMALPVARDLTPRAVVYDCMDELSAFKFAPPELLAREQQLLDLADVVFTGGPSLYRAKKDRHPNCHCFPSSVDAAHFGTAAGPLAEPPSQAGIPHPRLGFFGVIDERFDRDLLAAAAAARTDWQYVMVGPVVKVAPEELPRAANIHYLGQQQYADLPAFLAGWDVALLPFARNDSTKYISPTKTLEYMAAGKPIVSTPIADVADPYGTIVGLAGTPDQFVAACERALAESAGERAERLKAYRDVLSRTSWDSTAAAMAEALDRVAANGTRGPDAAGAAPHRVVVIGAGPTGLSAAYHLGGDALLLEANDRVGGWCRSIVDNGFTFDFAGHIMFSNDPYVHEMYRLLLGDNVHWQDREAWIYSKSVYTRYPFQGALYGLPAEVIKECIIGAIEARFGTSAKKPEPKPAGPALNGNGHANGNGRAAASGLANRLPLNGNGHTRAACNGVPGADPKDAAVSDCCGDGVAESTVPLAAANGSNGVTKSDEPRNFEEFIYKVWGAGIAKHFAVPYNQKIWAVPLSDMETSWLGGRVPMPDLGEMIEGALSPTPRPLGPNARFGYPLRGGFQALMDGFLPHLGDRLRLNTRVRSVSPSRKVVVTTDGEEVPYEQLVSTMPLPVLIRCMGDEVPDEVKRAAEGLRFTSVRCVNIGVGREKLTEKHWIYYPEDTVFHRVFVQGNASPHCNPPGGFGITCEITYGPLKPLPCDGDALVQRCVDECVKVGLFDAADPVLAANQVDMPYAYVVYDHARPGNVATIRQWLAARGIHLAGRYSEWEYYNSDHAFLAGKKVADAVRAALAGRGAVATI